MEYSIARKAKLTEYSNETSSVRAFLERQRDVFGPILTLQGHRDGGQRPF